METKTVNTRPIIGLLVQEASGANAVFGEFFIRAVHVRWIQLGGAMVVPIWPNREREYYEDIITKVNGIYLPGGGTDPLDSYYGRGVKILMELVMRENDRGVHMPVWAICLGLQSLLCHRVGKIVTLNGVDEKNRNTALEPAKDFEDSFLKKNIPSDILSIMLNNEILPHHHNNCITTKTFNSSPEMNEFFKLVSVNTTRDGTEYVATIEAKNYPIYALQWHTEKFNFHWCTKTTSLLHTAETILVAQAAANFFISEARKNNNKFDSLREEQAELIDNYNIVFVGLPTYGLFHYFSREDMTDKAHEARLQRLVDMRKQKLNLKKKLAEEEQSVVLNGIDHQKVII